MNINNCEVAVRHGRTVRRSSCFGRARLCRIQDIIFKISARPVIPFLTLARISYAAKACKCLGKKKPFRVKVQNRRYVDAAVIIVEDGVSCLNNVPLNFSFGWILVDPQIAGMAEEHRSVYVVKKFEICNSSGVHKKNKYFFFFFNSDPFYCSPDMDRPLYSRSFRSGDHNLNPEIDRATAFWWLKIIYLIRISQKNQSI